MGNVRVGLLGNRIIYCYPCHTLCNIMLQKTASEDCIRRLHYMEPQQQLVSGMGVFERQACFFKNVSDSDIDTLFGSFDVQMCPKV